jgi:hypothetical protein
MRPNFFLLVILLLISAPFESLKANEIIVYAGGLNHANLSGCCKSNGLKAGAGIVTRINFEKFSDLEISGFSNGKWNEAVVAKPFYILGSKNRINISDDQQISAKYVANWKWIASPGMGYFTNVVRTKDFDLPALVTGLSLNLNNYFMYSINQSWSINLIIQTGFGLSKSEQSFLLGGHLGLGYEF